MNGEASDMNLSQAAGRAGRGIKQGVGAVSI